jgi:hypothetical protein
MTSTATALGHVERAARPGTAARRPRGPEALLVLTLGVTPREADRLSRAGPRWTNQGLRASASRTSA